MKCKRCGECCRHAIIEDVHEVELVREPRLKRHCTPVENEQGFYFLKMPCRLLDKHNLCRIYPTRPTVCVGYEPGSTMICPQHKENDNANDTI